MGPRIRRVVTDHDADGKAIVIADGYATAVKTVSQWPGLVSTDLWKTDAMPVRLAQDQPDLTIAQRQLHPAPNGATFRISIVPPESDFVRNLEAAQSQALFGGVGNANASTHGRGGRHPLMRRTETLDYAVVLEGEITMPLDDNEINLKAGDVVIQRDTNHA